MSELDLTELRKVAEAVRDEWTGPGPKPAESSYGDYTNAITVLALLDRLDRLEANFATFRVGADYV